MNFMPTATASAALAIPNLASIRERKGISLEQIASSTKISARYLEAIERSEFDLLPGGVFRTSYIRQYARAIDYDEWDLIAHYDASVQTEPETAEHNSRKILGVFRVPQPLVRLFASEKRI